jgi:starch-binding outer membrane protein, SusD/RagB family
MNATLQYIIARQAGNLRVVCLLSLISLAGCRKYLEAPVPDYEVTTADVFTTDNSSSAALNSVYTACSSQGLFSGVPSVGYMTGIYGDELTELSSQPSPLALYEDDVSSLVGGVTGLWSDFYAQLYTINTAIANLPAQSTIAVPHKNQWLGEAYFLRGLMYFYITNLYGTAPLVLGTNYATNNVLARSPQSDAYAQIVSDLQQADTLLSDSYFAASGATTTDRGRPNRMAAAALLAKTYLYTGDWKDAEIQADSVIADVADYQLTNPLQTFLIGSPEVIWGIEPGENTYYLPYVEGDVTAYYVPANNVPTTAAVSVSLSDSLVNAFEPGDLRMADWVGVDSVASDGSGPASVYYYAYKYKDIGTYTSAQEYITMFRLGEVYLIRAEARAQQGNYTGAGSAASDLNTVRARAMLPPTTPATQADMLAAIAHERRVELFCENGNRFFDLRRTGALTPLMETLAPLKGGTWNSSGLQQWWPIPLTDVQNDPKMTQTPGYE